MGTIGHGDIYSTGRLILLNYTNTAGALGVNGVPKGTGFALAIYN